MTLAALTLIFALNTKEYKLPENLLASLCYIESTHNVNAINRNDGGSPSYGVCQLKFKTARFMGYKGPEKHLMKPEINIKYAAKYLAYQLKRYNNNATKAVITYNIGNAKGLTSTKYSVKVFKKLKEIDGNTYRIVSRD